MNLWMIVPEPTYRRLERERVLAADGRRVPPHFRQAYRWMAKQMGRRLSPPPRPAAVPWWAWARWGGTRSGKQDLRCSAHLPRGTRGCRLTIDMPAEDVLLSDFSDWHAVLNVQYLALNEGEWDAFYEELDVAGHASEKPLPLSLRVRCEESWMRIFDLERGDRDPAWCGGIEDRTVQATFWELQADRVQKVDMFVAR